MLRQANTSRLVRASCLLGSGWDCSGILLAAYCCPSSVEWFSCSVLRGAVIRVRQPPIKVPFVPTVARRTGFGRGISKRRILYLDVGKPGWVSSSLPSWHCHRKFSGLRDNLSNHEPTRKIEAVLSWPARRWFVRRVAACHQVLISNSAGLMPGRSFINSRPVI
jgi:hypothetical protein